MLTPSSRPCCCITATTTRRNHLVYQFLGLATLWVCFVLHEYVLVQRVVEPHHVGLDQLIITRQSTALASSTSAILLGQQPAKRGKTRKTVLEEQRKQKQAQNMEINRTFAHHTFNGVPVTYHAKVTPASRVQCIHNHAADAGGGKNESWMFRSCRFENLCLDMDRREYVLFVNDDGDENDTALSVALGGINPRWMGRGFNMGVWKVKWQPATRQSAVDGYYALPAEYVWIPWHSFAAHNVGHLIWDDFYPIFSLLRIFGLLDRPLFPLRHQISETLYASCDIRRNKSQQCAHNLDRFLPLLGVNPSIFSTSQDAVLNIAPEERKSAYVCAATAVTGLGLLTDHGWNDHGWNGQGHRPHNLGRGPNFAAFGDFLVEHILGQVPAPPPTSPPVQVVFSALSSRDLDRRLDFALQLEYLRKEQLLMDKTQSTAPMELHNYSLWEFSLQDQVRLARHTHIFVTACGGGAMTATFLPAGSVLIIYYNPTGGLDFTHKLQPTNQPARLDWDLLNNAGHLRVHWLPVTTMNTPADLELLHLLLVHEADRITRSTRS